MDASDETNILPPENRNLGEALDINPGTKLSNFVLQKRLGEGGMGEVWLAFQETLERYSAVKILSPQFAKDKAFTTRFLNEVKITAKMKHPNIVAAHDAGIDKGIYYLVIEYIKGEDLAEIVKKDGILKEADALIVIEKIADALKHTWEKFNVLHRDIKPANIMIDDEGEPRLMDMGISKTSKETSGLTITGAFIGTPHFISPEQADGAKDLDFRVDLYSLGATLFFLLTGEKPYTGETIVAVLGKLLTKPLPPPQTINDKISTPCAMLIENMMAKERDDRYSSWQQFLDDIDLVIEGKNPQKKLPKDREKIYKNGNLGKNNKSIYIYSVIAFVFVIAITTKLILKKDKKVTPTVSVIDNSAEIAKKKLEAEKLAEIAKKKLEAEKLAEIAKKKEEAKKLAEIAKKKEEAKKLAEIAKKKEEAKKLAEIAKKKLEDFQKKWNEAISYKADELKTEKDYETAINKLGNLDLSDYSQYLTKVDTEISKIKRLRSIHNKKIVREILSKSKIFLKDNKFKEAKNLFLQYDGIFKEDIIYHEFISEIEKREYNYKEKMENTRLRKTEIKKPKKSKKSDEERKAAKNIKDSIDKLNSINFDDDDE